MTVLFLIVMITLAWTSFRRSEYQVFAIQTNWSFPRALAKKHELNLHSANVVEWFFQNGRLICRNWNSFPYVCKYVCMHCKYSIVLSYVSIFLLGIGVVCSPIAANQRSLALMYVYFGVNMWYLTNDCSISKMIALVEMSLFFSFCFTCVKIRWALKTFWFSNRIIIYDFNTGYDEFCGVCIRNAKKLEG